MKIKFCGAAEGVTGSCHLVTTEKHKILLDCGQFQGGKAEDAMNYEDFSFNTEEIDCVVLSHAHIDHCGRLPLLVKRGFSGPIYCTTATGDLLDVMLKDSAYIHEKEAEWKNEKAKRAGKEFRIEPLYNIDDALNALKLVKPILYDQLFEINDEMKIVFNEAGHILGSSIVELWVDDQEPKGEKISKIVFSGDLGVENRPLLRDPKKIKKADFLIMEATYGNRLHPENSDSVEKLLDIVLKTIKRGGNVIIPSFAVGRTQELIFEFNRFYEQNPKAQKELDQVMVYIDSPMATTATEVFRRNAEVFDDETREYIMKGDNPLDFKNLKFTRSADESRFLNTDPNPKVIISASGMCEAGRIRHHLKHNLWDGKNSVIFVGYQAEGTLGRRILEGAKDVTLFGEQIHVNAEIHNLEGFSGHADKDGLLAWLSGFEKQPKQIFLVHGEEEAKEDFAKYAKEKLNFDITVIKGESEYELKSNELSTEEQVWKDIVDHETIHEIRKRVNSVHDILNGIFADANLVLEQEMNYSKVTDMNNILLSLEKDSVNLRSLVSEEHDNNIDMGDKA
ncbi:MAG: MBL fold metallo-hydrolase [Anaerovoracaceae bacterium]|jgi:metallo-beta-lactamase family protein|nr:MBL fold metallo-hydrolase [Anaerovoracaceae bacterium]